MATNIMVTYSPSEAARRYSRACPPYSYPYAERRYLSSSETRMSSMTERDIDSDPSQPRKRISVACGRCRKRKIRCSGDPGNGHPCSNCKNAGYEPCLFLRVSSTETPIRSDDFNYNLDAARPYSHQARIAASPMSPYATEGGDGMSYRHGQYPYGSKGYLSAMAGWTGAYPDDSVEYGINYNHPILGQDPAHMGQSYGRYGSGKSMYVDPDTLYPYGNLAHRPAVPSDSPTGFSLSGMAASLPTSTDRIYTSDRLLPPVNRTLTSSSSYRVDGMSSSYPSAKTSPTTSVPEVGYGPMSSNFDSPYSAPSALPSSVPHRSSSQHEESSFHNNTTSDSEPLYPALPPADEPTSSLSYTYGDKVDGTRQEPRPTGGSTGSGSILANGHVYIPDSHAQGHSSNSSQSYGAGSHDSSGGSSSSSSTGGGDEHTVITLPVPISSRENRSSGSSHMHGTDRHHLRG